MTAFEKTRLLLGALLVSAPADSERHTLITGALDELDSAEAIRAIRLRMALSEVLPYANAYLASKPQGQGNFTNELIAERIQDATELLSE